MASRGGVLQDRPRILASAFGVALALCVLLGVAVLAVAPAGARAGTIQQDRAKARAVAAEIAALDAKIGTTVTRYARAVRALEAVRRQIRTNERLQRLASRELALARATLTARAVTMYKHQDVSAVDAMFGADDFGELVTQLSMVRTLLRSDRDVLRTIATTELELADRAEALAADEKTRRKLVEACTSHLSVIRARLDERRAALAGVRSHIRKLATRASKSSPDPASTVEPPEQGGGADGSGAWWPLIRSAAASNGVDARGLYRLMMIESGGSATIVGPGGYYGLFQYARTTWEGAWNPWRSSEITDGAAQIRATALAIRLGYGHAWWDPSYTWAFQDD